MGNELSVRDAATLARRPAGALALAADQPDWTPTQLAALNQLGLRGAPPGDLKVLLHRSQVTGLDPFARQIYMIKRREKDGDKWIEKWTIQTGIDGFRIGARRAATKHDATYSSDDEEWCGRDRLWVDAWVDDEPPAAARFRVEVVTADGRTEHHSGVARYGAYAQLKDGRPTGRWRSGADQMLSKCAEALALRRAFPLELSGVYIPEEMDQAAPDVAPTTIRRPDGSMPAPRSDAERVDFLAEWRGRLDAATNARDFGVLQAAIVRAVETGYLSSPEARTIQEKELRPRRHALPADQAELTAMHAALTAAGITDRDDKLTVIGLIIGHPVESSADLTHGEARTVADQVRDTGRARRLLDEAQARAAGETAPPPGVDPATGEVVDPPAGGWPDVARPPDWRDQAADSEPAT